MTNWLRILIALVILMHGIGHILFLVPALGLADWGQSTRSWLLTERLGSGVTRAVGGLIWLAVVIAYVAGVVGMFTHAAWWPPTLVAASVGSVLGLILFWATPPTSPVLSALVVDVIVVLAVQVFHWPPQ